MLTPFQTLRGCTLAASDGEIGSVREFYFTDDEWKVRYLVVDTGSWLSGRRVLVVPEVLREVDPQSNVIVVDLTKEQVRRSPALETDKPVSRQHEEHVHQHYAWNPYWTMPAAGAAVWPAPQTGSVLPAVVPERQPTPDGHGASAAESDDATGDPHLRSSDEIANRYALHTQDGEAGRLYDFIVDTGDWCVRYLVARMGAWFFGKNVLLAPDWVERISFGRSAVFINLPSSTIEDAPAYNSSAAITRTYEERLHDHYGRKRYWDAVAAG